MFLFNKPDWHNNAFQLIKFKNFALCEISIEFH